MIQVGSFIYPPKGSYNNTRWVQHHGRGRQTRNPTKIIIQSMFYSSLLEDIVLPHKNQREIPPQLVPGLGSFLILWGWRLPFLLRNTKCPGMGSSSVLSGITNRVQWEPQMHKLPCANQNSTLFKYWKKKLSTTNSTSSDYPLGMKEKYSLR